MKTEVELSKSLKKSLDDAEQVLARTAEIHALVTSGEQRLASLSSLKLRLDAKHAEAAAGHQLGEVGADVVARLRSEVEGTEKEIAQLSQTLPVLRQRYADQHEPLQTALLETGGPLEFYAEKVCEQFAAEYHVAADAYAAASAKGRALSRALRIDIPTPPPALPTSGVEIWPAAMRVEQVLAAIDAALRDIERARQSAARFAQRRKTFDPNPTASFEFLRKVTVAGRIFEPGSRVFGNTLPSSTLEALYTSRSVRIL